MTTKHWIVYIIFLLVEVIAASCFMEIYKKSIRKNKYTSWECRGVSALLSGGCIVLLYFSDMMYPLFSDMFNAKIWLDFIVYFGIFYILQLKADMKIVKNCCKSLAKQWLKDTAGLKDDQIESILSIIEEKKS